MKQVIQLDAAGYYVGVTVADESPLEPGVFLLPGGTIDAPAPVIPEGKRAKLVGEWLFEDIPPPSAPDPIPEPAPAVPTCSPWQIRKALNALGLRQRIEASVAASEIDEVRDGWEFATVFRSDDPLVLGLSAAIGKTQAEVEEIIQYASTL